MSDQPAEQNSHENENENMNDLQKYVINMRRKYIKAILKTERQCNKIDLKMLERVKFLCDNTENHSPFKRYLMDEKLLNQFNNQDIENRLTIKALKHKLKRLDNNVSNVSRVRNSDIYKKIYDK